MFSFEDRTRRSSNRDRMRPRYDSLLQPRDRLVVATLVIVWVIASVAFWRWWLEPRHWLNPIGIVMTSSLLWLAWVNPLWFVVGVWRAMRPAPRPKLGLRVAMIVTKAPSEPWSLVRRTLDAMLDQDHLEPYDVWLADEDPDARTEAWCAAKGVRISTRRGVAEYHRRTWPRRTRCKEGNLAYFYDHWGYDDYDVVCQFDADHAPERGYLRAILAAFTDRSVGYVAAPSVNDRNASHSWTARARLSAEAALHGPIQAGHNNGLAPICFGSHYAVRTEALRKVGGLGPELAEDFTTTLAMNAAGYVGAFAVDAIAHGEGPESYADALVQEMQWARSMSTVFLEIAPDRWHGLPRGALGKLGFISLYYPILAVQMTAAYALIVGAVMLHMSWVDIPLGEFALHAALPALSIFAIGSFVRMRGWLRPANAPLLSWESYLFNFARWPWVAIGVAQSAGAFLFGRTLSFRVTPKASTRPRPFPTIVVAPHLVLAAIAIATVAVFGLHGPARGYALLALVYAAGCIVAMTATLVAHLRENPGLDWRQVTRPAWSIATTAAALVTCVIVRRTELLGVFRRGAFLRSSGNPPTAAASAEELLRQPSTLWILVTAAVLIACSIACHRRTRTDPTADRARDRPTARPGAPTELAS